MCSTINSITPWIPFLGTLLGAGIAFAASFFTTKINKDKDERLSRESRDRDRIEKIYRLLVAIGSERGDEMAAAINSIHHAKPIVTTNSKEFPPLRELEMLINLYFPSMEIHRKCLMTEIHEFGKRYLDYGFKDYRNENINIKQRDSEILIELKFKIDNEIEKMQKLLVENIKA